MFVHLFQIILNFMYVCQSVSWLISLLKLYKYRYISSSGWNILNFLRLVCWYVGTVIQEESQPKSWGGESARARLRVLPVKPGFLKLDNFGDYLLDAVMYFNHLPEFIVIFFTKSGTYVVIRITKLILKLPQQLISICSQLNRWSNSNSWAMFAKPWDKNIFQQLQRKCCP